MLAGVNLQGWVQAGGGDVLRSLITGPLELRACEPEPSELETFFLPPPTSIQDHLHKKAFLQFRPPRLNPLFPLQLECQLLYLGMPPCTSCFAKACSPRRTL